MKKSGIMILILLAAMVHFPDYASAKTGYVSDQLLLTFRSGPGTTFQVLKTLKSNTKLEVLEEDQGYLKVQLESGDIGWVDKKYIIYDKPSALIAQELTIENARLKATIEKLQSGSGTLKDSMQELKAQYASETSELKNQLEQKKAENTALTATLEKSRQEYDTLIHQSKNIQQIILENKKFKQENLNLSKSLEELEVIHKNSFRTSMIKWFLAGVGVLLLGWLLGSFVPQKRKRRGSLLD